jgi:citrate lyase gamma subunit
VHNEIEVCNRKLRKQLKVFNNAALIEVNLERDQFTRYGLHLNSKVKDQSAKKTVNTVKDILNKKKVDPVTMKWKEEYVMDRVKNHIPLENKNQL